jgi:hypothetical protein
MSDSGGKGGKIGEVGIHVDGVEILEIGLIRGRSFERRVHIRSRYGVSTIGKWDIGPISKLN